MSRQSRTYAAFMMLVAATLAHWTSPSFSAEQNKPLSPEARIREALDRKISLDFEEDTLTDVVEILKHQAGIEIMLDARGLDEIGIDGDQPTSIKLSNVSLAAALRHLLHSINPELALVIQNEVLLITTREVFDASLQTAIYDVADFASQAPDRQIRHVGIWGANHRHHRFDDLIEIITGTVQSESWDEVGGPGTIAVHGDTLILTHNWRVHEDVKHLLGSLRTVRELGENQLTPVSIEYPSRLAARRAIQKALVEPIPKFHTVKSPLSEVVDYLRDATGLPILIDTTSLNELGINNDTPVTVNVKGKSLRAALRIMLHTIDPALSYQIVDEVLVITTKEFAEANLQVQLYPVADLIGESDALGGTDGNLRFDSLIEAITTTVQPESWDEIGGAGSMMAYAAGRCLVIAQTESVHEDIQDFLAKMRSVAAKQEKTPAVNQRATATDPAAYRIVIYHVHWPTSERHAEDKGASRQGTKSDDKPQLDQSDKIVKLVRDLIEPDSWEHSKAAIHAISGKLVIRQKDSVHRQVEELLEELKLLGSGFSGGVAGTGGGGFGF